MADDVVFLVPCRDWRHALRGGSDIREIEIHGDRALPRTHLTVVAPPTGGVPVTSAGHTLSVLRKENGRRVIARDANLSAPFPADHPAQGWRYRVRTCRTPGCP